jgi:hypothetical protein
MQQCEAIAPQHQHPRGRQSTISCHNKILHRVLFSQRPQDSRDGKQKIALSRIRQKLIHILCLSQFHYTHRLIAA